MSNITHVVIHGHRFGSTVFLVNTTQKLEEMAPEQLAAVIGEDMEYEEDCDETIEVLCVEDDEILEL